jgi:hypothetical protein
LPRVGPTVFELAALIGAAGGFCQPLKVRHHPRGHFVEPEREVPLARFEVGEPGFTIDAQCPEPFAPPAPDKVLETALVAWPASSAMNARHTKYLHGLSLPRNEPNGVAQNALLQPSQ